MNRYLLSFLCAHKMWTTTKIPQWSTYKGMEHELGNFIIICLNVRDYDWISNLSFLYVCMVNTIYLLSFVETPRKFIIAELSIRKLGSSSVLIILLYIIVLLALMKIQVRIESSAIINLRGVSTKLNKYNI